MQSISYFSPHSSIMTKNYIESERQIYCGKSFTSYTSLPTLPCILLASCQLVILITFDFSPDEMLLLSFQRIIKGFNQMKYSVYVCEYMLNIAQEGYIHFVLGPDLVISVGRFCNWGTFRLFAQTSLSGVILLNSIPEFYRMHSSYPETLVLC